LPQPAHKDDQCISIPSKFDQPCYLEEITIVSKPCHISITFTKNFEPCQQLTIFHYQPTAFQIKIRMKMFKPLNILSLIHPYPLDCYEYLPLFSRENQASAQRHLEPFEDLIDRF
jgi:hypothetical protein